jgi:diguanylate cyclase (GGDEF)-like protein/PAS domain S-box-containing protein
MNGADPQTVEAALSSLLAMHPDAWVGAVGPTARYVPVPAGVPGADHPRLHGRWALDHVVPGDRPGLADAWRARRARGVSTATARLLTGGTATFHVFDVSDTYGADIVVAVTDGIGDLAAAVGSPPAIMASRFCRILRDEGGRAMEIDNAAPSVLGFSAEDLLSGRPPLERIHPDDHPVMLENWMATLANLTDGHRCRARVVRPDGSCRWFELTNFNRLDDPERPHIISEMLDISEEMAAHEAVAAREQLLHRLAEALPLGVLQLDNQHRVIYKNDYLGGVLGVDVATTMSEQFATVVDDDRSGLHASFSRALDGVDGDIVVSVAGGRLCGERIVRVITKSLLAGNEVSGVIACISDVTEATRMGRELERRATYDALTGCHNRASILASLAGALTPDGRHDGAVAIFVDLDGLKEVNDRLGHAVGDELLKVTARVLQGATRSKDVVGRLGGDEFLVVCHDVADESVAVELASRIADEVRRADVAVAGTSISLRASVGVAWAAKGSVEADHLVRRADEAMYASKREAAGRPHVWQDLLAG